MSCFAGEELKIIYPEVISASRATDIPACHAAWLMSCLRGQQQCLWQNPFNARQKQIVSFDNAKAVVFWSKNPAPLIPYLDEIADMGKKFYFQFTLNDYGKEGLEPGVPPLKKRMETFQKLAQKYRVIWRYDPLIAGDSLTLRSHLHKVGHIMQAIGTYTPKLVFSFVDMYGFVARNLASLNSEYRSPYWQEMENFSRGLLELRDKYAPDMRLATCAEGESAFQKMGIEKNSCIDPILINEICHDEIYKKISTPRQLSLMAVQVGAVPGREVFAKDKGQRKACLCAPSKDIGSYRFHHCKHHCVYCYGRHAKKHAIAAASPARGNN